MSAVTHLKAVCAGLVLALASPTARAELAISQLIVDLRPGAARAADIEIQNNSDTRSFVSVEPREIIDPGRESEKPFFSPDPEKLGLLVSPTRLVIEAHQRRRLRIAAVGSAPHRERIYRITVKPVTGEVTSTDSGLKLLVGYDLLVLVRPLSKDPNIEIKRTGGVLDIINKGNASIELANGKVCSSSGERCEALPSKRLYAGVSWKQTIPVSKTGEYRIRSASGWSTVTF